MLMLKPSPQPTPASPSPDADALPPDVSQVDHRTRLMNAMGETLIEKAYGDITIADVVAQARVSKRTFYEQFQSKDACLLALCEKLAERRLAVMSEGVVQHATWQAQLSWSIEAYLQHIQVQPALIRTLCIELMNLGPAGLAVRRSILDRFVHFLLQQVETSRQREAGQAPLTPLLAVALVGGVNELILHAIEQGRADHLRELAPEVTGFIRAVLLGLGTAQA
jgi:AcrR family transcriptional regulator